MARASAAGDFDALRRSAAGRFRMQARTEFGEIAVHGDRAHFACRLAVTRTPIGGGDPMRRSGRTSTIPRKQPNGRSTLARDANVPMPD